MEVELPLEILSYIMEYLDFSSRREAALVCQSWYEASLNPMLLKNTQMTFDASFLQDSRYLCRNGRHILQGCLCKSSTIHISNLDENINAKLFLNLHKQGMKILGPHVIHLSLKNATILEGTLCAILQYCDNLTSLDLTGCNSLFMTAGSNLFSNSEPGLFGKIKRLNFSSTRYMNDTVICRMFELCPQLQSLSLASDNLLCNSIGVSKTVSLTFLVVQQMIEMHSYNITSLDFSRTSIMSEALSMLAHTKELSDKGVVDLARNHPKLKHLDISGCLGLGDGAIYAVCCNSCQLETFKLRKCHSVTGSSIQHLNKLQRLKLLDISESFNVNMGALRKGIHELQNLKTLQLKCCNLSKFEESFFPVEFPDVTISNIPIENALPPLSPIFSSLIYLDIGSSHYVDDVALQAVNVHLLNLRTLKLAWCSTLTDKGLLGIEAKSVFISGVDNAGSTSFLSTGRYSKQHGLGGLIEKPGADFVLEEINLSKEEIIENMESRGITRLRNLETLTLYNCQKITPTSLVYIFKKGFPGLKSLDLGMLHIAVTDDVISEIANTSKALRFLSVSLCSKVSDLGIETISKNLRNLESLNLSSCDLLTEKSFSNFPRQLPWLKELDISMCRKLSSEMGHKLLAKMPALLRLLTMYSSGQSLDKTL